MVFIAGCFAPVVEPLPDGGRVVGCRHVTGCRRFLLAEPAAVRDPSPVGSGDSYANEWSATYEPSVVPRWLSVKSRAGTGMVVSLEQSVIHFELHSNPVFGFRLDR